jgi:competence protein ComEC
VARLADGTIVAIATSPAALADDCMRAVLVLTTRVAPPRCGATIIDRTARRAGGALALRRGEKGWDVTAAQPPGQDRPWAPAVVTGESTRVSVPGAERPAVRDATPRTEDLGADD